MALKPNRTIADMHQ